MKTKTPTSSRATGQWKTERWCSNNIYQKKMRQWSFNHLKTTSSISHYSPLLSRSRFRLQHRFNRESSARGCLQDLCGGHISPSKRVEEEPLQGFGQKFEKMFKFVCEYINVELPKGFNLDDRSLWPRINFVSRKVVKLGWQHRALMDSEIKEIMCAVRTIKYQEQQTVPAEKGCYYC